MLMKKLAGTKWGAGSNILKQVYTGNVRPVMEYGAAAWATAAKSKTSRLTKEQPQQADQRARPAG